MLSRRKVLAALGILAGWGCHQAPELPPATEFIKDIRIMDRDGRALPNEWSVSQANPVDPTIQFEAVKPPTVLGDRKVLPADQWIIVMNALDKNDKSRWSGMFRGKKQFAEEKIGDQQGQLVWESPDAPKSLTTGAIWQWCHCRVPETGRFTLVFKLYPTVFQMPNSLHIDYGEGLELARQTLIVEPGQKPEGTLQMSLMNADMMNRSVLRRMRTKNK